MTRTHIAKWLTLLSVVLALALTAALAACGSDEPSGVTGPDGTASPKTETTASPDRTASTPTETPVLPRTDAYHARVRGRAHRHRCTCDSAARGLRLRRNGPGSPGCPLQRNGR